MSAMQVTHDLPGYSFVPEFTLGDRLRRARDARGLSQWELADLLGISQKSISNYENDAYVLDYPRLVSWADECQVNLSWLAYGRADVPPPSGRTWASSRRRVPRRVTIEYPEMSCSAQGSGNRLVEAA